LVAVFCTAFARSAGQLSELVKEDGMKTRWRSVVASNQSNRLRSSVAIALLGMAVLSSGCLDRELKALNPCLVSGVARKVAVTNIDFVDLLFVVDNSGSMRQEQGALKEQFPPLISTLTNGRKSDGTTFPPVKDLHLGVVSTDMGLAGVANNFPGCNTQRHINGGDDGVLLHPGNTGPGCEANYPQFLSFIQGMDNPEKIATDFGCIANLGTSGCGFEQQLEAGLKALWPKNYVDADGNIYPPEKNPILFLSTTAEGRFGHGDVSATQGGNLGFLRNDPIKGLSLISIIIVSDEEDCSSKDTKHFVSTNDPANPLSKQGINLRCYYNKMNLFEVDRYVKGFTGLRPGNTQLVIYGAIIGVPKDLVSAEARADVNFEDQASRDAYYDMILSDTRMVERPMNENVPAIANVAPSCTRTDKLGEKADAYPPVRMVQVAKGIGQNAVIQSICQDNFGPAMDAIIDVIAKQLGAVCLPRPLVRKADGFVGCNVVWELPKPGTAPSQTPTDCNVALGYLGPVDPGRAPTNERMGKNCKVKQLAVTTIDRKPDGEGWYYDDFSDESAAECPKSQPQRVSFSDGAKPPTGVTVKLECLNETQKLSNTRTDIREGQPEVGQACSSVRESDMMPFADDDKCVIALKDGTEDRKMFCHPKLNVCVKGCTGTSECPAGWVCDARQMSVDATGGKGPYCTNPTCGAAE
jgi:hypothetical protein